MSDELLFPAKVDEVNKKLVVDSQGRPIAIVVNEELTEFMVTVINAGVMVVDAASSDLREIVNALDEALKKQESALMKGPLN